MRQVCGWGLVVYGQNFFILEGVRLRVGLELAWGKGLWRVLLWVDSPVLVHLRKSGGGKMDSNVSLLKDIKELLARDWVVK